MTRYHMMIVETDERSGCIGFYSTDTAVLLYLSTEMGARFGVLRTETEEVAQAGQMSLFLRQPGNIRMAVHYVNQFLCGSGWEPFDPGCFRLRY